MEKMSLEEKVAFLLSKVTELEEKINAMEERKMMTGVVLDGVSDKNRSFIEQSIKSEKF